MKTKFTSMWLSLLLIGAMTDVSARQQTSSQIANIVLDISVFEFSAMSQEDLQKLSREQDRIKLLGDKRVQPAVALQMRLRSGEPASTRVGQRIPIQSVDPAFNLSAHQVQYENTGLSVNVTATTTNTGLIDLKLGLEMSAVDRGTGTLTPTILQRSLNDQLRVRSGETALLLGMLQHEPLYPTSQPPNSAAGGPPRGSFVVMITARLVE